MSLPARIEPDFFELAMAHSRHNLNDRAQTIVDLNGGNRVKNLDMRGMGSNATKDLGLMTVVGSADCFFIEGSRFALRSQREVNVGLEGAEIAPVTEAALNADLAVGARLDLDMLRAFKSDIVTMPELVQHVQMMIQDLSNYSEEQIQITSEFIQNFADVNSLLKLDMLPHGMDSIIVRLESVISELAEDSKTLFDQGLLPNAILTAVIDKIETARVKFDLPQLEITSESLEGRINAEAYLVQSIDDLKQSLTILLDNPDISDAQKEQIKSSIISIEATIEEGQNPLQITQILAIMQTELLVNLPLPETVRLDLVSQVERVNDAVYVVSANNLGITVDQIRTLDQIMIQMAIMNITVSQSFENLSSEERKLLDHIQSTLQIYNTSPISLATLDNIKDLQQSIASIEFQKPEFKTFAHSIDLLSVQLPKTFGVLSATPPQILAGTIDRTANQLSSILSIKMGISAQDVGLQAVSLRAISNIITNQIATSHNKAEIQNLVIQPSNIIPLKQFSSINPSANQTNPNESLKKLEQKLEQKLHGATPSNDINKIAPINIPSPILTVSKLPPVLTSIMIVQNQLPTNVVSILSSPLNPSVKSIVTPVMMAATMASSIIANKNIPTSNTNIPTPLSQRVNEVTRSIVSIVDPKIHIMKRMADGIISAMSNPESKVTKSLEGLRDTAIKTLPLLILPTEFRPDKIKTEFKTACGDCPGGASCKGCFNDQSKKNPFEIPDNPDPKSEIIRALGRSEFKKQVEQFGGGKEGEEKLLKVLAPTLEKVSSDVLKEAIEKTGNLNDAVKLVNKKVNADLDNAKNIEKTEKLWGSDDKSKNTITVKISEGINQLKKLFGVSVSNTKQIVPSVKLDEVTINSVTTIEVSNELESSLSGFKASGKTRTRARAPSVPTNG